MSLNDRSAIARGINITAMLRPALYITRRMVVNGCHTEECDPTYGKKKNDKSSCLKDNSLYMFYLQFCTLS